MSDQNHAEEIAERVIHSSDLANNDSTVAVIEFGNINDDILLSDEYVNPPESLGFYLGGLVLALAVVKHVHRNKKH